MSSPVIIAASEVSAGYGRNPPVLHDISFSLRHGERLAIIGPNGCGKTTLLRVLAGIIPYRGTVHVRPADPDHPRAGTLIERSSLTPRQAARETALLVQLSPPSFPFTVHDAVLLGRYARQGTGWKRSSSKEDKNKIRKALADCGILDLAGQPLTSLSGGQIQRVYLARALAQDPAVLLLDEPTNHLDLQYQLDILDRIRSGVSRGQPCAAIGVFHDLFFARRFADTLLLMDSGSIVDRGTPDAVLAGETVNRVYHMNVGDTLRELSQL